MSKQPRIILASASQRRTDILHQCGIPHTIAISNCEEKVFPNEKPRQTALHNAQIKAQTVAQKYTDGYVIGADTIVTLHETIIGKPKTQEEARSFLQSFSRQTVNVYTGLHIIDVANNRSTEDVTTTAVYVKELTDEIISHIIEKLDPLDRAGGFSIEGVGSYIFDNIKGSFYNVLGLPPATLYTLFNKLQVNLLELQ